ncbi:PaaI family thioesterase [Xanthobacter wiegelii]
MRPEIGSPVGSDVEQRIRGSFQRQGLMAHLGATISEVRHGLVTIRMPFRPELSQQHGYFHAGGTSAIADSAGGYAGFTLFPEDSSVLTVELKVNLLNPAQGDALEAVGKVVKAGKTLTICQLEVFADSAKGRSLVAIGQQTLICMAGRPDVPAEGRHGAR